jgi:cellulose synthase/poly-beta-1,6-N-acetylglucosamine synthase-like glycosyltransferase
LTVIIATILIGVCAAVLLLPALSDLLSVARLALWPNRGRTAGTGRPRLLVLVPAHNEELLIEPCVRSLRSQRYPSSHLAVVVIADNCTDSTAAIARSAGARCLERSDLERKGKPRAIEWALTQIDYKSYEAVVIVDADTVVDPNFASVLGRVPDLRNKAVQAFHGVRNPGDSALTRMGAVFATARYQFEFRLKSAAGLNVPLMGNGMCIGTEVLAERGWTAFSICEDWEMYAQLTERGVRIEGRPNARLYSQEARSLSQSASQRRRWAAGKLSVLGYLARPLIKSKKINFHQKLDVMAELLAVGPAVHLAGVSVLVAATLLLNVPGATWLALALSASIARLGLYTAAAIRIDPAPLRALSAFAFLPYYAVWRLLLQLSALRMLGEQPWVRTERHV